MFLVLIKKNQKFVGMEISNQNINSSILSKGKSKSSKETKYIQKKDLNEHDANIVAYKEKLKEYGEFFLEKMAKQRKEYSNRKTSFVEIKLCDVKVQVFKIEKGVNNNTLIRKSFWINKTKISPVSSSK